MRKNTSFLIVRSPVVNNPTVLYSAFLTTMKKHGLCAYEDSRCRITHQITLKKPCELGRPLLEVNSLIGGTKMLVVSGKKQEMLDMPQLVAFGEHSYTEEELSLFENFELLPAEVLPAPELLDAKSGASIIHKIDWDAVSDTVPWEKITDTYEASLLLAPDGAGRVLCFLYKSPFRLENDLEISAEFRMTDQRTLACAVWARYLGEAQKVFVDQYSIPMAEDEVPEDAVGFYFAENDVIDAAVVVLSAGNDAGETPADSIPYQWDRPTTPAFVDDELEMEDRPVQVQILRHEGNSRSVAQACYSMLGRVHPDWHDEPIDVELFAIVRQAGEKSYNMDHVPVQDIFEINLYLRWSHLDDLHHIHNDYGDIRIYEGPDPYQAVADHYMTEVMAKTVADELKGIIVEENARQAGMNALEDTSQEGQAAAYLYMPE